MLLSFNVEKQIITRTDTEKVVTNSMNYLYAQFTFTDEWVGEKTAVFKGKHGTYNALLDAENKCLVPWEILTEAMFDVSVFCGDLITANAVKIFTIQSGYEIGDESRIPTPEIYTQVINKLNEIEAEIDPEAIQRTVDEYLADKEIVTEDDVEQIVADYIEEHKEELKGDTGPQGPAGPQGPKGDDGANGVGVPTGGTTGQVLTKKSNSDYDTEWSNASGGVTPQEVEEIVNGYPSYVDTEKKAVLSRLWTTYASVHNPVVVGFNTDQHLHNNMAVERVAILTGLHALRDMTKEFPFNICVLGGDACGNSTIKAICNEVNDVTNALDGANCPVIHISGNHDSWNNNNNMIKGQLFSALATSTFRNKVVTTTDNTNNCYYDDEVNQIRYIFLNDSSMRGYDLNKINVRDFMVNALETLPNFFAAIIFSHHPLGNLTDTPHTRVDDWNEPLNFGDYVAPYKDRIIVCICGHVHADKSEVKDGILYLSTTCAGRTELNDGSTRTDGQADVTAQDVMVIDREHYVIHCIRYGNGNDRNITYYVPTYTNVLASAIDTDGTVFNGVGYQEGKRLNSSGGTTDYDISDVSGYIPVNANDVIRIRGAFMSNKKDTIINYINFYNSDFSFKSGKQAFNWWLGKDTTTSTHDIKEMTANDGNIVEFKVPENADFDGNYMRISCELLSQAIITINEDIPLK